MGPYLWILLVFLVFCALGCAGLGSHLIILWTLCLQLHLSFILSPLKESVQIVHLGLLSTQDIQSAGPFLFHRVFLWVFRYICHLPSFSLFCLFYLPSILLYFPLSSHFFPLILDFLASPRFCLVFWTSRTDFLAPLAYWGINWDFYQGSQTLLQMSRFLLILPLRVCSLKSWPRLCWFFS